MPTILLALLIPLQEPVAIPKWGVPLDADKDCTIRLDDGVLTISVPGTPHEMNAFPKKRNAPRVLRDVESNWTATVKATVPPAGDAAKVSAGAAAERSAGLLVWLDEANFIRVARAQVWEQGEGPRASVVIEYWRDGRVKERHVVSEGLSLEGEATWLRLTRRIDKLKVEASDDGQTWAELATVAIRLSSRLKFGVVATNTSGAPLDARLSDLEFRNIRLTP
jgi:regulation of enolase protein 1 (concanavalin A-like superfamily)